MLRQPASREPFAAWLAGTGYGTCLGEERGTATHELPGRSVTHCGRRIRQIEGESHYTRASMPASRAFTAGHSSSVMLYMTVSRWWPCRTIMCLRSTPSRTAPSRSMARCEEVWGVGGRQRLDAHALPLERHRLNPHRRVLLLPLLALLGL